MQQKINFLQKLNSILNEVEEQIIQRATDDLIIAERHKTENNFITDYEVEATVDYYIKRRQNPIHTYCSNFSYNTLIKNKDYSLLLYKQNTPEGWREGNMPDIGEPYCYLLHDLLDHSKVNVRPLVYNIETIWIDIIKTDQRVIKIF